MVEHEWLEPVYYGVLRMTSSPRSFEQDVMIGVLLGAAHGNRELRSGASGLTAAVLLDLMEPRSNFIHILTSRKLQHRDAYRFHWTTRLPPGELTQACGVPCTDAERTLLDLCDIAPPLARWAYRRGLRKELFTEESVAERIMLEARRGRGGIVMARELLAETSPSADRARSALEDVHHDYLVRAGYPAPLRNVSFPSSFGHGWEIDLYYPSVKQGFEVSPYDTHSSPEVYARDGRKELDLARLGIKLWRITEELTYPEFISFVRPILGPPGSFPSEGSGSPDPGSVPGNGSQGAA
jgi:hypothetical protein